MPYQDSNRPAGLTRGAVDLRAHALAYARAGLPVFPLAVRDKKPATVHGLLDATTDPDTITGWWSPNRLYNIGIRPPVGVVVLDIDPRNGGTLDALGALPETWTAATGGGGLHLWFRCSGTVRGHLDGAAGIDIKSHNGYLVAPPSVHPSGNVYRWLNIVPIAPLPDHLRVRVRVPAIRSRPARIFLTGSGVGLVRYVAEAQEGHRNHALFWAASRAYQEGNAGLIADLCAAAAVNGLREWEIEQTVRSARMRASAASA